MTRPSSLGLKASRLRRWRLAGTALVDLGLAGRIRGQHDGRRKVITVSAAGRRLLRKRDADRVDQRRRAIDAELSSAELLELDSCLTLLDRLARRLGG